MTFSEWFDWVLREAELYDYGRYPVKGFGVWMPYGFKLRKHVIDLMRSLLDSTGHEEILLPLLIPEDLLAKESEHVRGFEDQVFWVTHGGLDPLEVKLALRPTSETSLTYMESFWIKSYKQLPKKYYQVVSIFRYETKATRAMLRVREVSTFKEAHTVHEDFRDSERQVSEAVGIYSKFFDLLGIPYVVSRRPDWDKFPGALYTIAFDTLMPDGRALQIGTVHNLGQNFTKVFEVKVQRRDESIDYAWQTSYGISERVIATVISTHGDEKGLVLPFKVAPTQVVVVPIPAGGDEEKKKVFLEAGRLSERLENEGFRAYADLDEEKTPSEKFVYWELKGVPLRIDLGPRELSEGKATVFRRDTLSRLKVPMNELPEVLRRLGEEIDANLSRRAWEVFKSRVAEVSDLKALEEALKERKCLVEIPWCGSKGCVDYVTSKYGLEALGTPLKVREDVRNGELRCPVCGGRAVTHMRYARKY
jgi:prolyl-tRNA synthetase